MFFTPENEEPVYTDVVEINLSDIEANLSGPKTSTGLNSAI